MRNIAMGKRSMWLYNNEIFAFAKINKCFKREFYLYKVCLYLQGKYFYTSWMNIYPSGATRRSV